MARTRTSARPPASNKAATAAKKRSGPRLRVPSLARWLARTCRPRSGPDLLTLVLVMLAIVTLVGQLGADIRSARGPGSGVLWCLVLLMTALAVRSSTWWRRELSALTRDRVQIYAGSLVLVAVALSVTGHVLQSSLAWGSAYPFLGPFSHGTAAVIALSVAALAGAALLLRLPLGRWIARLLRAARHRVSTTRQRRLVQAAYLEDSADSYEAETVDYTQPDSDAVAPSEHVAPLRASAVPILASPAPSEPPRTSQKPLPPIETFKAAPKTAAAPTTDLEHKAQRIEETLASFNVAARVVGHHSGPVVTQFDVQPERGVKVKSITALQNDLALSLAAPTIRIQAPVPGKPVVGIEIPNSAASTVALRELLESDQYTGCKSPLAVVLGKDVAGNGVVIDLARMPHLLIAGATGSGKSVCVNALISCLLYRNTPEEVRLMMVDPKMVELTVYNGVPHLLSPVVTQMDKVVGVLQWALREMERRYQLFADSTVRNIQRYNEKMDAGGLKRLPYIVFIIDELADLMMVSPEDVEDAICRLAQLARAAGIHLVIATQRPSVDVVTGLIKANFPARIAFAMTSQVDSRTILDTAGAEKLLGRGDMLYQPPDGPKPVRLQGAYLSDSEIERLVEFWKRSPLQAAVDRVPVEEFAAAETAAADASDELLEEAIRTVREFQHASVSLLQRRLRIGYARAARVMDQLEARGVVGPADGSKQRPVLDPADAE